jgi:hypothetical protein
MKSVSYMICLLCIICILFPVVESYKLFIYDTQVSASDVTSILDNYPRNFTYGLHSIVVKNESNKVYCGYYFWAGTIYVYGADCLWILPHELGHHYCYRHLSDKSEDCAERFVEGSIP